MKVKTKQKFASKNSQTIIRVQAVQRDQFGDSRYDRVTVVNLVKGKSVKSTERTVLADSIRRRYYPV